MSPRPDSPGLGLGLCLMAHESDHFEIGAVDDGGTAIFLRFALKAGVDPAAQRLLARPGRRRPRLSTGALRRRRRHAPRSTSSQRTS